MLRFQGGVRDLKWSGPGRLLRAEPPPDANDSEASWVTEALPSWSRPRSGANVCFLAGSVVAAIVLGIGLLVWVSSHATSTMDGQTLIPILFAGGSVLFIAGLVAGRSESQLPDPFWQGRPLDEIVQWSVEIDIVQEHVITGTDSGKLWIQDRSIYFVGKRTSFVLSRWQLASGFAVERQRVPLRPIQRSIQISLAKLGTTEGWSLQMDPHDPKQVENLSRVLHEVAHDPNPFQLGQFPPRSLGPDRCSREALWFAVAKAPFALPGAMRLLLCCTTLVFLSHWNVPWEFTDDSLLVVVVLIWAAMARPKVWLAVQALRSHGKVMPRKHA